MPACSPSSARRPDAMAMASSAIAAACRPSARLFAGVASQLPGPELARLAPRVLRPLHRAGHSRPPGRGLEVHQRREGGQRAADGWHLGPRSAWQAIAPYLAGRPRGAAADLRQRPRRARAQPRPEPAARRARDEPRRGRADRSRPGGATCSPRPRTTAAVHRAERRLRRRWRLDRARRRRRRRGAAAAAVPDRRPAGRVHEPPAQHRPPGRGRAAAADREPRRPRRRAVPDQPRQPDRARRRRRARARPASSW